MIINHEVCDLHYKKFKQEIPNELLLSGQTVISQQN